MDYHPYSGIWPLLKGDDFEKLKNDIKTNGLRVPVITYQGKILDGRNRERACEAVGVPVRYEEADIDNDDAALDLVVSLNEFRRHLSFEQRAFAAARLANFRHGGARNFKYSRECLKSETTTLRDAAENIGVSYGSAARAKAVLKHGTEADIKDIIEHKVKLTTKAADVLAAKQRPAGFTRSRSQPVRQLAARPSPVIYGAHARYLSPQEVDPEFTGTPTEFTAKYGHVQVMTAEQYATTRFSDWAQFMRSLAKLDREMPEIKDVDLNWLRSPAPSDVGKLADALDRLRPRIAQAEAMLERAKSALNQKKQ